ncbi:hypothetical protein GCM10023322_76360 [Rugosimonospora acidiphila]|uniref:Uncharacterized protein n=1 Tax=Rugosimonospora acidiphila TaxID=556531 RepID=A0ABP9SPN5_9ACTN
MRASRVAIVAIATLTATLAIPPAIAIAAAPHAAVIDSAGAYYPLATNRMLDTRVGNGAQGPVGPGGVVRLQVDGRGGVPSSGVSAVVLNVTVTSPTAASYLTLWPDGDARPTVSDLDFPAGWTGANEATVSVGPNGEVDIYNHAGNVQIIADVVGFYAADNTPAATLGAGLEYRDLADHEQRLEDTRNDGKTLSGGSSLELAAGFFDPAYYPNVQALVVTVTAVGPTGSGFLTAWDGQGDPPTTSSTLNFSAGKTVANTAIVPTSSCTIDPSCAGEPEIGIYNALGSKTNVLVDLVGYYEDATADGARFEAIDPVRIADTRTGLGGAGTFGPKHLGTFTAPSSFSNVGGLAANVTAVAPTADTYLTIWEVGDGQPPTSNLDPAKGSTVANTAQIVRGNEAWQYNAYNFAGNVDILIDIQGVFVGPGESYPARQADGPAVDPGATVVAVRNARGWPVA